mmetsp:Transcript_66831/g.207053  ORF Transcript_66831/g.207053 Transcript_66831/m.207053 type:complete len:296 (-) Transcript_66831:663-1550(-)
MSTYTEAAVVRQVPPSNLHARGLLEHRAIDTLHHRLELLHGPHLVKLGGPSLDHALDAGLPENGLRQLPQQQGNDGVRGAACIHRGAGRVHVDVALGWAHPDRRLLERGFHGWHCRRHEGCVEGTGTCDELCLQCAPLLYQLLQLFHRRLGAAACGSLREESGRYVANGASTQLLANLLAEALELVAAHAGHGEQRLGLALPGGRRHGLCIDFHNLQAVLERHHPRSHERSQLTHAETSDRARPAGRLRRALPELLEAREAGNEERRMAELCLLQLGARAVEADVLRVPAKDGLR